MKKKKILLVGGAGFIGFNFINLYSKAHDIYVIDNYDELIHGDKKNIKEEVIKGLVCSQLKCDFSSKLSIDFTNELSPDAIIILVSQTGTSDSQDRFSYYINENINSFCRYVSSIKCNSKIILPSSRAVYGNGFAKLDSGKIIPNGYRTYKDLTSQQFKYSWEYSSQGNYLPHSFDQATLPVSIYGMTKLAQEGILNSILPSKNQTFSILRLQNVIGPHQSSINPYTGLLCWFVEQALRNDTIKIYENGEIWRDFIDVRDVCRILSESITVKLETFIDVGTGIPLNLEDLVREIIQITNSSSKYVKVPNFRIGDIRWAASNKKLPYIKYTINNSIRDYIESTDYLK